MNEQDCKYCFYSDTCGESVPCENYTPIDGDEALSQYIEMEREEYRRAWFQYIAEDEDSKFF